MKRNKEMLDMAAKAIDDLKGARDYDTESAHVCADRILCELLVKLGFTDVVNQYNTIEKWYA